MWLEVQAPVRDYHFVKDLCQWKMIAIPKEGHHLSVTFCEVKVRKFNVGKRRAEIVRIGKPITDLRLGTIYRVRMWWDGDVIRTSVR